MPFNPLRKEQCGQLASKPSQGGYLGIATPKRETGLAFCGICLCPQEVLSVDPFLRFYSSWAGL